MKMRRTRIPRFSHGCARMLYARAQAPRVCLLPRHGGDRPAASAARDGLRRAPPRVPLSPLRQASPGCRPRESRSIPTRPRRKGRPARGRAPAGGRPPRRALGAPPQPQARAKVLPRQAGGRGTARAASRRGERHRPGHRPLRLVGDAQRRRRRHRPAARDGDRPPDQQRVRGPAHGGAARGDRQPDRAPRPGRDGVHQRAAGRRTSTASPR